MKTLRQLSVSVLLMIVLAMPVIAGDMQFPAVPPPPPPATSEKKTESNSMPTDTSLNAEMADFDALTEITLLMLQSVLSLF